MSIVLLLIIVNLLALWGLRFIPKLDVQFVRFIFVGSLNTFIYYESFLILNSNLQYIYSHVFSFIISAFISYFLTTMYTFKNKVSFETFIKFPLTFLPNLFFSTIGTYLLVQFNIINEDYASITMMVCAVPVTFLVSKLLLSKKEKDEKNKYNTSCI